MVTSPMPTGVGGDQTPPILVDRAPQLDHGPGQQCFELGAPCLPHPKGEGDHRGFVLAVFAQYAGDEGPRWVAVEDPSPPPTPMGPRRVAEHP